MGGTVAKMSLKSTKNYKNSSNDNKCNIEYLKIASERIRHLSSEN